ncbi:hypothetical protein ILUMI_06180 [Ignelater luminosus]|uniref:DUF4371 domain-containing protein n=1 Tax=Ignelater luminosus TaxID=2038154 RepID=A0A8K0D5S1_IGNLU|nr:hypothetical protein ILUMI_06180 [Ignelater luminosus]
MSGSQYTKKRLKKEKQGRKLSYVMKEFLVQKSCLDEPFTSHLANKNSVSPQSLPEEIVEGSQKIIPSEVPQEPGSNNSGSQQILIKIPSDFALWNAFCIAWKQLDIRLKQKKTIDAEYQRIMDMEIQHWRGVLKRIMSIIILLASQCLAVRGTTEHLFQPNNENFFKLVELLSEFGPVMEKHIRRVQREFDKWSVTYLSNNIQDELINLMGNVMFRKIVEITKIAKCFSIIADCTPDVVSHIEQLSLTIRVVAFNSIQSKYEIEEFLIDFFEGSDSIGDGFDRTYSDTFEKNLECSTEFPAKTEVRARRKKRQFDYAEAVDEPLTEENKFKK